MIAGIFHEGSGLGDQLFRYITVRTLAEEKGFDWTMWNPSNFKGDSFLTLNYQYPSPSQFIGFKEWNEKDVRDAQGNDIRSYDPEINFVEDNTTIDGSFEDSKYWHHNLENINKWLAVEPLYVPDDLCVIGFRGGEYYSDPNLGLSKDYYQEALGRIGMLSHFQIHTDDPQKATEFFSEGMNMPTRLKARFEIVPNQPILHSKHTNMAFNWRSARYAKYAIIPNSAFFILPRLLKHLEDPTAVTIAPRWWARRNTKGPWRPAAYYSEFTYI